jgi:hypothetical protein
MRAMRIVGGVDIRRHGTAGGALPAGDLPLEYRLRRLHRRRRRAVIRRLIKGAFWSVGLLGAAVFVIGVSVEVAQR